MSRLIWMLICFLLLTGCKYHPYIRDTSAPPTHWTTATPTAIPTPTPAPVPAPVSTPTPLPVQRDPVLLDYYLVASELADAYRDGEPVVASISGVQLELERVLAYVSLLIPQQLRLQEETRWLDDTLESVRYECSFPLAIDSEFDKATRILHETVDRLITPDMADRERLREIHDWVIGRNVYPDEYGEDERSAAALVFYGNAICSGYADAVKIMCDRAGIPAVNLSGTATNNLGLTGNHGWNLVYVDGQWLHLDATYDDPKTTTGKNVCLDDYFLVSTESILRDHALDRTLGWDEILAFADYYYFSERANGSLS